MTSTFNSTSACFKESSVQFCCDKVKHDRQYKVKSFHVKCCISRILFKHSKLDNSKTLSLYKLSFILSYQNYALTHRVRYARLLLSSTFSQSRALYHCTGVGCYGSINTNISQRYNRFIVQSSKSFFLKNSEYPKLYLSYFHFVLFFLFEGVFYFAFNVGRLNMDLGGKDETNETKTSEPD